MNQPIRFTTPMSPARISTAQAKFLALGILSPGRAKILQQATEEGLNERNAGVKTLRQGKRRLVRGLSSLGVVLILGIFLASCASETPEDLGAQAVKKALPHYPPGTSKIHWLDPELYWELQKISIENGGTGSPHEVDDLYDGLR
jgi:ABC-type branched-subunit amino acid transport system substrate-binding protein